MTELIKLVTSNQNKINEYRRFGLPVEAVKGKDIKEVKADSVLVAKYKSLEVGEKEMVEDTVLVVDGNEVVDIRYRMAEFQEKSQVKPLKAEWTVTIAMKEDGLIKMASATVRGFIGKRSSLSGEDVFGFDDIFYPYGKEKSLHQLEKESIKDEFSARRLAIVRFIEKDNSSSDGFYKEFLISKIPKWEGDYQE